MALGIDLSAGSRDLALPHVVYDHVSSHDDPDVKHPRPVLASTDVDQDADRLTRFSDEPAANAERGLVDGEPQPRIDHLVRDVEWIGVRGREVGQVTRSPGRLTEEAKTLAAELDRPKPKGT